MNTTIEQNDMAQAAYRRALEEARRKFKELLRSLPKETAGDLVELFQQLAKENDEQLQAEIVQTIEEIVMPESMNVKLRAEFELTSEDVYVRDRLTSYRQKVGETIKKRRTQLKMSEVELAEKVGISQSHICRLETGLHVPTHVTIERVASALDATPSQLDPGFTN